MESATDRLGINCRDSTVGQGTESHLRTISCEATIDLFLITVINKSNYKTNIKRSA